MDFSRRGRPLPMAQAETRHVDPVCGMTVAADSPHRVEHAGTAYRFCCAGCAAKFREDPRRYLDGAPAAHAPAAAVAPARPGTRWTCPMHPEMVRDAPGP